MITIAITTRKANTALMGSVHETYLLSRCAYKVAKPRKEVVENTVSAIAAPMVRFNTTTNSWECIGDSPVGNKKAYKVATNQVFSGVDTDTRSDWKYCNAWSKSWKDQSKRARQYRPLG